MAPPDASLEAGVVDHLSAERRFDALAIASTASGTRRDRD
jgi:hypothetical protein